MKGLKHRTSLRDSWQRLQKGRAMVVLPDAPELLSRPREMGAVAESSRYLAKRMAKAVDPRQPGLVVELGPGKGAITRALLKHLGDPERFLLIDVGEKLVQHLQERFPRITVVHGSAEYLHRYVQGQQVAAVVSGLPLRSLPRKVVKAVGAALSQVMDRKTLYIQFTYDLRPGQDGYFPNLGLRKVHSSVVWRNLLPARVDVFRLKKGESQRR